MQFAKSRSVATPDVEAASDAEWKTASERAAAMERLVAYGAGPEKITEVSEHLGLSKAMIYRLLARYRRNPAPSELLPRREGRAAGVGRLNDEVEAVIQRLIVGYYLYLKKQRPRVVDLYRQIALSCRTKSLHRRPTKRSAPVSTNWIRP
jgi:putative transposase